MIRQFLLLFFLYLLGQVLYAQGVTILDAESGAPVAGVVVYNADKSHWKVSDAKGRVVVDKFGETESLYFQHTAYTLLIIAKNKIENRTVSLSPNQDRLDEVVLSASKFEQGKREVSQKVLSISREDVAHYNPQTTADLLSGSVFVQKSQQGGGSPMIRGFSANRLLITVDGVRMNSAIFRSGNIQNVLSVDPFLIENAEVILGPGSVVYGSDALGGVMSFHTLQPKLASEGATQLSGSATLRHATANNEKTGHVHANLGFEKWALLTSVTYNDFGDMRMGRHGPDDYLRREYAVQRDGQDIVVPNPTPRIQKPTAYKQLSLAQKLRYEPNSVWALQGQILYSETSDIPRYDRLTRTRDDSLREAVWHYGPQQWLSSQLMGERKAANFFYDTAKFVTAYQHFGESRNNRSFGSDQLFSAQEKVHAYSANVDFAKSHRRNKFTYGAEYVRNHVLSEASEQDIRDGQHSPTPSRYPNGSTWQSAAAYVNYTRKWNPKISLLTGLRYSHFIIDTPYDDRFEELPFSEIHLNSGNLTGSMGLVWFPAESIGWRATFATAFRAPNIDDMAKVFDTEPGAVMVPNPDLKAEYAYTGELGLEIKVSQSVRMDFASYYTLLDNALVRRDYNLNGQTELYYQGGWSRIQAIQNASMARVYGFEAAFDAQLGSGFSLRSNLTVANGFEELEDGQRVSLRHVPPTFGNSRLVWEKESVRLEAYAHYSGQIKANDLAPTEAVKPEIYPVDAQGRLYSPGWHTLNLASHYRFSDTWSAQAAVENLTDQRYRTYGSGIAAAGRNLILSVQCNF